MNRDSVNAGAVRGEFIDRDGERFYAIRNVDKMPPFFISVVSNVDHWLFVSSTGGLTAGRVSPETALFPYGPVDRIHESTSHTGCKTIVRIDNGIGQHDWEPFNQERNGRSAIRRNLYKNLLGNKLCFEEINEDLELAFACTWATSDSYGFVRRCRLHNLGEAPVTMELLDGLQNILPAGTPRLTQANASNLVDAYKWTELDVDTGLALFTLYSGVSDRAQPAESLRANTAFCLGLDAPKVLISSEQLSEFRRGARLQPEQHKRGIRGAFLVHTTLEVPPQASHHWQTVANVEQSQAQVADLRMQLKRPGHIADAIRQSIEDGTDELARIMARGDGFQLTAEETVSAHHYANVLFNILRGGIFADQYRVPSHDFNVTVEHFNHTVHERNRQFLARLPGTLEFGELLALVQQREDVQLERLCYEYLPITFGRRHGDPSRPWNNFAIKLKDDAGEPLLSYEGNWRDIFQNWEALTFSYPEFIENVIAKFVNASTVDGYNPYRITKEGIDWEVDEPDDPWSYIGYWGDHQIIYLLKLLELSQHFHPARLGALLRQPVFSYANVPYRIKPFEALLENPKDTVVFDTGLAKEIERRVEAIGADGKLLLDQNGTVYQVNLLEKLLVPLLGKLGNLVIDGGIWLNTQRPEWNDANNALVGHGLSMVTLYYLRRYIRFLQKLLETESDDFLLSLEVMHWLRDTAAALKNIRPLLGRGTLRKQQRRTALWELGESASRYRGNVYEQGYSGREPQGIALVQRLLDNALAAVDHSISSNKRDDGLYHAYNLLNVQNDGVTVDNLYPMLEGQVAALSAGAISVQDAVSLLEGLFASDVYRADQHSFMLYPNRDLPGFFDKNRIDDEQVRSISLLVRMLDAGDERIVVRDADRCLRFNADFSNAADLDCALDELAPDYGDEAEAARKSVQALYEEVFNHRSFTGRSGGMFGFEGLGSIYWHMVAKLLLAVQENYFDALESGADATACRRLGQLYYRVREGIGFNKTPADYGAFPTDPYSHTPGHSGARQPGMTGQVKEEVLSRFGELGVRVRDGAVSFRPALLRTCEFVEVTRPFCYLDVDGNWQDLSVPVRGLAFTWCQVPVIYRLQQEPGPSLEITERDGQTLTVDGLELAPELSADLYARTGRIRKITVMLTEDRLFNA